MGESLSGAGEAMKSRKSLVFPLTTVVCQIDVYIISSFFVPVLPVMMSSGGLSVTQSTIA